MVIDTIGLHCKMCTQKDRWKGIIQIFRIMPFHLSRSSAAHPPPPQHTQQSRSTHKCIIATSNGQNVYRLIITSKKLILTRLSKTTNIHKNARMCRAKNGHVTF